MRALIIVVAVLLMVLAESACTQEKAKAAPDPQASFEPRSKPGVGQKLLEKLVGDWDVTKTFHPRIGTPFRVTGTCRQTMIHAGRFLQSEFVFEAQGTKSTGLGLLGFEASTGKFTSVWTDSRATRISFRQSLEPFNGEEIVLFGQALGTDGSAALRSRTNTRLEDNNARLVHRQVALEADGKERLVMELVLTRRSRNPAQAP